MGTGILNTSKENSRILVISASPFPSYQGTQVAVSLIINHLLCQKKNVDLLTYPFGKGENLIHPNFNHFCCRDIQQYRNMRSGPDMMKLALDIFLFNKALDLTQTYKYSQIHAHNYEALFIGLLLKKKCGLPLVYFAHNLMQSELSYYYHPRFTKIFHSIGKTLDSFVAQADSIICLSENLHTYFRKQNITQLETYFLSQNDLPKKRYPRLSKISLRKAFSLPYDKELAGYCGNLDRYQNIEWFEKWLRKDPCRALLIASHESFFTFQKEYPSLAQSKQCFFKKTESVEDVYHYMKACDYTIIPRQEPYGIPIKMLNLYSWNLKVIHLKTA